ncbi:hypothetical protein [Novipirellula caenicola]|uniref:Protein kinase domain-containing protein n=1 Tax=Novipirellula caenicola TaxID=1536901 RepID=A0ABP9VMQ8_9BACT
MNDDCDAVQTGDLPSAALRRRDLDSEHESHDNRPPPTTAQNSEPESLRDCIANAGTLAIDDAIIVVDQIAAELDRLHRGGKVHRAISPSSIVLTDDGFARIGGGDVEPVTAAQEFDLVADVGRDLRGLGWTLHYMLSGDDPTASADPIEAEAESVANRDTADLGAANPIFRRLVSRDETDRYESAVELRIDLRRQGFEHLEPLADSIPPITSSPESGQAPVSRELELPQPRVRRNWVAVGVVVTVIVVASVSRHYWMG